MKKLLLAVAIAASVAGCDQAHVASSNLSKAADNFEIIRRVVFYNTWMDKYLLTIEGLCSMDYGNSATRVAVTCKTGLNSYKKHYVTLSGHMTVVTEQLEEAKIDTYHYRVIFRPATLVPHIEMDL